MAVAAPAAAVVAMAMVSWLVATEA